MDAYEDDDFKFVDEENEVNRIPENESGIKVKEDEIEKGSINKINLNENYENILPNQENTMQYFKEELDNLNEIKENLEFDFSSQNFDKNSTANEQNKLDNIDNTMKDCHHHEQILNFTKDNSNNLVNTSEINKEEIKLENPIDLIVDQLMDEFKINQEEKKEENYQQAKDINSHDIIQILKEDKTSESLNQKQQVCEHQTQKDNFLNQNEFEFNEVNEDNNSEKQKEVMIESIESQELEEKNLHFIPSEGSKVEEPGIIEETKNKYENSHNKFSQNLTINNYDILYEDNNYKDKINQNDHENLKSPINNQKFFTDVDEISNVKEKFEDEMKIENNQINEEKIEIALEAKISNDLSVNIKKEEYENLHAEKNFKEFYNYNETQRNEELNSVNAPDYVKEDDFEFNEINEENSSHQAETECFKTTNFEFKSNDLNSHIDEDFEFKEITEEVNSKPELNNLHEPQQITNITNLQSSRVDKVQFDMEFTDAKEVEKNSTKISAVILKEETFQNVIEKEIEVNKEEDFEFNDVEEETLPPHQYINKEFMQESNVDTQIINHENKFHNDDEFEFNEVAEEESSQSNSNIMQEHAQENPKIQTQYRKDIVIPTQDEFEFNDVNEEKSHQENRKNLNGSIETSNITEFKFSTYKNFEIHEGNKGHELEKQDLIESTTLKQNEKNQNNVINDNDFEFNEVTEEELHQNETIDLNPDVMIQNQELQKKEEITISNDSNLHKKEIEIEETEDDFFDFVEEDDQNNKIELSTKVKNDDKSNEIKNNQEQTKQILEETYLKKNDYVNSNLKIKGKNTNLISKLLSEYKENYFNTKNNFISRTNEKSKTSNYISDTEIKNFYLNIDDNNLSMKNVINLVPSSKYAPEVALRALTVEEINKLGQSSSEEKNTKSNNDRDAKFKNAISEFSNASIKQLYYKYIDLKNLYVNIFQAQSQINIPSHSNKSVKIIKKEIKSNEDKNLENKNYLSEISNKKDDILEFVETENATETKNKPIENNAFAVQLENTKISTIIEINETRKNEEDDESDENEEEEEFQEVTEEKNSKAIFIDEVLYSIMMDTNSSNNNFQTVNNKETSIQINTESNLKEQLREDNISDFNENKMLEYLKNMTMVNKNIRENENNLDNNSTNEKEKNDLLFQKLIDNLPNYNFLISKYVEYPDSIFNI